MYVYSGDTMIKSTFFQEYFRDYQGKELLKPRFYFDIYERYTSSYRGSDVHFLEIGVFKGGSLDMWHSFLGKQSTIYGVDIDPSVKEFEKEGYTIYIGDQADTTFLESIKQSVPHLDIILDDGGHYPHQQIRSFISLFPHLKDTGIYIVEDVHTSYYPQYYGGYGVYYTFQNFALQLTHLINLINIHYSNGCNSSKELTANLINIFGLTANQAQYLFENIYTIHFYDSIIVFEKVAKCRNIKENLIQQQHIQARTS